MTTVISGNNEGCSASIAHPVDDRNTTTPVQYEKLKEINQVLNTDISFSSNLKTGMQKIFHQICDFLRRVFVCGSSQRVPDISSDISPEISQNMITPPAKPPRVMVTQPEYDGRYENAVDNALSFTIEDELEYDEYKGCHLLMADEQHLSDVNRELIAAYSTLLIDHTGELIQQLKDGTVLNSTELAQLLNDPEGEFNAIAEILNKLTSLGYYPGQSEKAGEILNRVMIDIPGQQLLFADSGLDTKTDIIINHGTTNRFRKEIIQALADIRTLVRP